jgi:hypothetical protein
MMKNTSLLSSCADDKCLKERKTKKKKKTVEMKSVALSLYRLLDQYKDVWDKCSVILIEQQLSKSSYVIRTIEHYCYAYFLYKYANFKKIVRFHPKHKTQQLCSSSDADDVSTTYKRKAWARKRALQILTERNDEKSLDVVLSASKQDDLCDAFLQIQAFKRMTFGSDS